MLLAQDPEVDRAGTMGSHGVVHPADMVDNHAPAVESSTESIPVHPLGVKPLGNAYFASGPLARDTLGPLGILPDEMILNLLEHLDKESLRSLGSTCRFLYAFGQLDELWKPLYLEYVM